MAVPHNLAESLTSCSLPAAAWGAPQRSRRRRNKTTMWRACQVLLPGTWCLQGGNSPDKGPYSLVCSDMGLWRGWECWRDKAQLRVYWGKSDQYFSALREEDLV